MPCSPMPALLTSGLDNSSWGLASVPSGSGWKHPSLRLWVRTQAQQTDV